MIQVYDKYGKIKSSGTPGAGTVTSFSAGNLSPLFTTAVTSPTSTPNLGFSAVSQSQNLFYASPNGIPGVPSFRAILASDLPSLSTLYVPYTGATANVDLGEYQVKTGQIEFDQTPTGTVGVAIMRWNDQDGTVDLGLKGGNVNLQIGQEQLVRVVNKTATSITLLESNYQAVRVTGAQGQRLKVDLAIATTDVTSAETIGLVTETILNNEEGFVTTSGLVRGINTTGSLQGETWNDGDMLYLSSTVAGRITKVKPVAPQHLIIIGYVVSAHITQGQIFVKVDNGYELDELHNVKITGATANQVLAYTPATDLWENKTIPTILGYLPVRAFKSGVDGVTVANTLIITPTYTQLIPANTFTTGDVVELLFRSTTITNKASASSNYIYINTTNNLSGTPLQLGIFTSGATSRTIQMERTLSVKGATTKVTQPTATSQTDTTITGIMATLTINWTIDQYFIFAIGHSAASATESLTGDFYRIIKN